jgi:polysaccharide deacetylase family protein (PEP-CTERM system associated)
VTTVNAFTVDLEDWYQGLTSTNRHPELWSRYEARLERNADRLLALLDEHGVTATFFVLGHVAHRYPGLIRRIGAAGHEIGVHGYWHRKVHSLSPERFADELDQAMQALEPLISKPIIGHRAPYFSIDRHSLWALDILWEKGFRYDSSFFPTRNMLYGYPEAPRFPCQVCTGVKAGWRNADGGEAARVPWTHGNHPLTEFPLSTARWFGINWPIGGGFYIRTLPYAIIRLGIRQLNRQGQPAILYMHPWEIDLEQEYRQVTFRERITHYHGRRSLARKLRRLFEDFDFSPVREILDRQPADAWSGPPPDCAGGTGD